MEEKSTALEIMRPIVPILEVLMKKNLQHDVQKDEISAIVMQEIENLNYLSLFNPKLAECHPDTIRYCMRKVIMQGLSFDPDAGLIHVTTYNTEIGGVKSSVMVAEPSVNGEISILRRAGTLSHAMPPGIKYDEDGCVESIHIGLVINKFNEKKQVTGTEILPFDFDVSFFKNLEKFSHARNAKGKTANLVNNTTLNWANANYSNFYPKNPMQAHSFSAKGGIQPGFAVTKAFKHALRLSKLDKNLNSNRVLILENQYVADAKFEEPEDLCYNYEEVSTTENAVEVVIEVKEQEKKEEPPVKTTAPPVVKPQAKPKPVTPPVSKQTEIPTLDNKGLEIKKAIQDSEYGSDVRTIWEENQSYISSVPELMTFMKQRGRFLDESGKKIRPLEVESIEPMDLGEIQGVQPEDSEIPDSADL